MAEGSVLGANSFLKSDTEPWTIYAGSPAKPIKTRKSTKMIEYARELGYEF
jgi:galactoside O-acetyltransferase